MYVQICTNISRITKKSLFAHACIQILAMAELLSCGSGQIEIWSLFDVEQTCGHISHYGQTPQIWDDEQMFGVG